MRRIHLLRFAGSPGELAPLAAAAATEGLRIGWLDLAEVGPAAPSGAGGSAPPGLEQAVSAGAFRAVGVRPGRTVALKTLAGPPVFRDLLREHFLGCSLVVVRTDGAPRAQGDGPAGLGVRDAEAALDDAPRLLVDGERFRVEPPGRAGRRWTAAELAGRLRKPRPWE